MRRALHGHRDLDFAAAAQPPGWSWLALALSLLVLLAMGLHYQVMQRRMAELETQHNLQGAQRLDQKAPILPAELEGAWRNAQQTRLALNVPWLQTLSALETVQVGNPGIYLLSVQPAWAKSEIQLGGEARDFAALSQYLNALQLQFGDATLLSHRLLEEETDAARLGFTISLEWH